VNCTIFFATFFEPFWFLHLLVAIDALTPPPPHFNSSHNKYPSLTRGVSHCGLAKKRILRQKKKLLWKLKYFTMQKYTQSSKKIL
jgi:hypothetical protein